MTSISSLPTQGHHHPHGLPPPSGLNLQASLLLSQQSKSAGSKFLVTLCYIQSAHKNMQTPSQKIVSFTFPNPYPRVLQPSWQRYHEVAAKENIFSRDLLFVVIVVGLEVFCFCFSFFVLFICFVFDGEWSLRLSFDVFCIRPHSPRLSLLPSLSPSLFLPVCVCLSGFYLLLFPFWFLVAGLH